MDCNKKDNDLFYGLILQKDNKNISEHIIHWVLL